MKKIEIIIESVYINRFFFLKKWNKGYTIIKDIQGAGGHGRKTADDVTDVFSNNYVFTICEEKFLKMQTDITIL